MLDTMARQGEYSHYARVAALDPATGTPPGAGRSHRWARGCARAAPRTDPPPGEVSAVAVGPPSGMRTNGERQKKLSYRSGAANTPAMLSSRRGSGPEVAADGLIR